MSSPGQCSSEEEEDVENYEVVFGSVPNSTFNRFPKQHNSNIAPPLLSRQNSLNLPFLPHHKALVTSASERWTHFQKKWKKQLSSSTILTFHEFNKEMDLTLRNTTLQEFEIVCGDGPLGLEFRRNKKEEVTLRFAAAATEEEEREQQDGQGGQVRNVTVPAGKHIKPGLIVRAINGKQVHLMSPEKILKLLRETPRPMTILLGLPTVTCRLCECRINTQDLEAHTAFCTLSTKNEIQAKVFSNALCSISEAISAGFLGSLKHFRSNDQIDKFFRQIQMIALQAANCNVKNFESLEICSSLLKELNSIKPRNDDGNYSCLMQKGASFRKKISFLIQRKMAIMRTIHKSILQISNVLNKQHCFYRSKSLGENTNDSTQFFPLPKMSGQISPLNHRVKISDFKILKPISKGGFGRIYLAQKKTTGDRYAIKILAKEHILRKKQTAHIEAERNILLSAHSPFVVKLFWSFQSRHHLFLVMEFLPGGDFMSLLDHLVRLDEEVARVYAAEITLSLKYLHSIGCVHRDLKPDNILIGQDGHIKLTDFGLSNEGVCMDNVENEKCSTSNKSSSSYIEYNTEDAIPLEDVDEYDMSLSDLVPDKFLDIAGCNSENSDSHDHCDSANSQKLGTPDYLSPEIILGQPHGKPADFWALGIILYEMLVGVPPFNDNTVDQIFSNIIHLEIIWPDDELSLSIEAQDLIIGLLDHNPETRYGCEEVMNHPFFDDINWDEIREATPPFVPTLEGVNDTSYFNNRNLTEMFTDNIDVVDPSDPPSSSDKLIENSSETVNHVRVVETSQRRRVGTNKYTKKIPTEDAVEIKDMTDAKSAISRLSSPVASSTDPIKGNPSMHVNAFRTFSYTNMDALLETTLEEALEDKKDNDAFEKELKEAMSNDESGDLSDEIVRLIL